MLVKNKRRSNNEKRLLVTVVTLLLLFCTIILFACGGDGKGDDKIDNRPNLTLTSNIDGIAKLTGGGHYDYNEDVRVSVEFSDEYTFWGGIMVKIYCLNLLIII